VLVDERSLWPSGQFVTTLLVVRTDFLNQHPTAVKELLQAQMRATDYLLQNTPDAQATVNQAIADITTKKLADGVISAAWKNLTFTNDPIASSLKTSADHANQLGLLANKNLVGIFDLNLLNQDLVAAGRPTISTS
jgi:NitT/TauT family transport system substrate-binding protein